MVWDKSKGEEIKIAAISDGVDYNHPDLCDKTSGKCNLLDSAKGAKDFAKGDNNPQDDCPYQHCNLLVVCKQETCSYAGTYSASIISALTNNNKGMAGMAPESQIIPLRVGLGNETVSPYVIAEAIDHAVSIKQARGFPQIIYTTLEPPCTNRRLEQALANSIKEAVENGIVVILPTTPMCDLESQYTEVAGEFDEHQKLITINNGVILVGAFRLAMSDEGPGLLRADYSGKSIALTGLAPGGGTGTGLDVVYSPVF